MATENKPSSPPSSPEDEEGAQKELAHLGKSLQHNANGAFNATHKRAGFEDKTLWDKLNLFGTLAIPIVVILATIGFGLLQAHLADLQHQNDLKIAQDNRQNDLKIADDQQQEATLKAYLDDMNTLLLDKKLGSQAEADKAASAEAAVIGRSITIIALSRLADPQRKAAVVQFLYEAHLIGYFPCDSCSMAKHVIDLYGASLYGADLRGATLRGADLNGATLSGADLRGASLYGADLSGADLSSATLSGANLYGASLYGADLRGADLRGAKLDSATLSYANLSGAYLNSATLSGANLSGADLSGANLQSAAGITIEELEKQAKSLQGTIMPDGTIHP